MTEQGKKIKDCKTIRMEDSDSGGTKREESNKCCVPGCYQPYTLIQKFIYTLYTFEWSIQQL